MISKVELNKHVNEPRMAPVKHKGMLAVLVYCKEMSVNDHHGVMLGFWSLDSQEEMDQFGHVNSTGTFFLWTTLSLIKFLNLWHLWYFISLFKEEQLSLTDQTLPVVKSSWVFNLEPFQFLHIHNYHNHLWEIITCVCTHVWSCIAYANHIHSFSVSDFLEYNRIVGKIPSSLIFSQLTAFLYRDLFIHPCLVACDVSSHPGKLCAHV